MASATEFAHYPAFPADVPTAKLSKISLRRLFADDVLETRALFESCRSVGFFLLDLSGHGAGEALVNDIDTLLQLTKLTMTLPEEEKMRYHAKPPEKLFGYKALGFMRTKTKQPDRCEFFMLSRDELRGLDTAPKYPPPIDSHLSAFNSYLEHANPILEKICQAISTSLGLPPSTFFDHSSPPMTR